jgi:hypothetical protein
MARGPLAGASGPGKFSARTDLNMGSIAYGEGVETAAIKSGAPLARTENIRPASAAQVREATTQAGQITPLYAPTQRPDEPITAGVPIGAGPGPEVLAMNTPAADTDTDKQRLLSYLPALEVLAQSPNSSQAFRNYVRTLRANLL